MAQPPQQEGLEQAALGDTQPLPEVQERSCSPSEGAVLSQAPATCCSKLFGCFCSTKSRESSVCKGSSRSQSTSNPVLSSASYELEDSTRAWTSSHMCYPPEETLPGLVSSQMFNSDGN